MNIAHPEEFQDRPSFLVQCNPSLNYAKSLPTWQCQVQSNQFNLLISSTSKGSRSYYLQDSHQSLVTKQWFFALDKKFAIGSKALIVLNGH